VHFRSPAALGATALLLALSWPTPAAAQSRLAVDVIAPAAGARISDGPTVAIQNVFGDDRSQELLTSGFPARITLTVELWRSRTFFDEFISSTTIQRVVQYDALSKTFRVGRVLEDSIGDESRHATLDAVRHTLSAPARIALPAPPDRRGLYYAASVTIETFNSNDLLEVRRWLSGEVEPSIHGKRNPGSALTRGIFTLFSRLLGGDVKHATARSDLFDT